MVGIYSLWLVALSFGVALIASFAALDLATRVAASRGRTGARYWLMGGAMSMGIGIWSMHFIGMLAFSLPISVAYDVPMTAGSLAIAVLASGLALWTVSREGLSLRQLLAAGGVMGGGIASMHYLGMWAMRIEPGIDFDPLRLAASVAIAVVASIAAMKISFQLRSETIQSAFWRKSASALVMATAITGMHYTGMSAASFDANSVCTTSQAALDAPWLGTTLAAFTAVLLATTLLISMFESTQPTIRSRLALLATSCVVPAILLTVASISNQYRRERIQLENKAVTTARAATFVVDRELAIVESALLTLATSPHIASGDLPALHAQASRLIGHLKVTNVYLMSPGGEQLINTLRPIGSALPATANPALLRRVLQTGRPAVSDIFTGAVARRPLVAIVVPVVLDGRAVYALGATIEPARLSDILVKQNLPDNWIRVLVDSSGTIVARTHELQRFLGKKAAPAMLERLAHTDEGSVETRSVEGIPIIAVFSRSSTSRWSVGIGIPTAGLTAELWQSIRVLLAATTVLLMCGLGMAWMLGGRIATAIYSLVEPAHALGRREKVVVARHGLAEVNEVAQALEAASRILQQSQHDAHHDSLTGLANRGLFGEIVARQLTLSQRQRTSMALLYIDLDGFKPVNDRHGHDVGDALLRAVAIRLEAAVRQSDSVARLGGDEFAVVLPDAQQEGAALVAQKLVDDLSQPFVLEGLEVCISASIGIAAYPGSADTVESLLRHADQAMYGAKKAGKQRFAMALPGSQDPATPASA